MKLSRNLLIAFMTIIISPASSQELFLGSMLPMVKVENLTGKGSAEAVAIGTVPEEEMKASCEALTNDPSPDYMRKCIDEMKAKYGHSYRVSANCSAGTMQPAIGGTYTYAGLYTPNEAFGEKNLTKWRDHSGEIQPVARATDAFSLDQNWKILCGENAKPYTSGETARSASFDPEKFGGMSYDHNGSIVRVNEKLGEIRYEGPKKTIARTVTPGTLLFKGTFIETSKAGEGARGTVEGTAYVFKRGCSPAPYQVSGTYDAWTITLKGPAPKRDPNSCSISEPTSASKHSVLKFEVLGDY